MSKLKRNGKESLTHQAQNRILSLIVSGEIEPGERISEQALSDLLKIGRTPVREAIRGLVSTGLMQQIPRYGTMVRKPEVRDIIEIFEVREAVESFAVFSATEKLDADDFKALAECCQVMADGARRVEEDPKQLRNKRIIAKIVEADQAFHLHLIRAAGNRRIMKILSETQMLGRTFAGKVALQSPEMIARTCRDHEQILRALKQGDGIKARDVMIQHIRRSRQETVEYFERINRDPKTVMGNLAETWQETT